jgi:hypothetical protein
MSDYFEIDSEKLLSDKRVIEEIQRHLWIESEKAGCDIGIERATEDWLKRFSKAWVEYHLPEELLKAKKAAANKILPSKTSAVQEVFKKLKEFGGAVPVRRRRAKSYF